MSIKGKPYQTPLYLEAMRQRLERVVSNPIVCGVKTNLNEFIFYRTTGSFSFQDTTVIKDQEVIAAYLHIVFTSGLRLQSEMIKASEATSPDGPPHGPVDNFGELGPANGDRGAPSGGAGRPPPPSGGEHAPTGQYDGAGGFSSKHGRVHPLSRGAVGRLNACPPKGDLTFLDALPWNIRSVYRLVDE